MKVIPDGGAAIDLGETEATPTIGIVDYSRRETDEFGVTTVAQRDFSRRMSVRIKMPFEQVDAVRRQLAALRATPAQWVADEDRSWLNFRGFYRDFEIDLATKPLSFCTLTVESLAASEAYVETGEDPAPGGSSILQLLQPATIDDEALIASSVAENDYPQWSAVTTYGVGARVLKAGTHRIYESASLNNTGNDPTGDAGVWLDIGPTNRWAMFDQALGSITSAAGELAVTLAAGTIDAVALLDVKADTVRVHAPGYDRTQAPNADGTVTFLDVPQTDQQVSVTLVGAAIEVGTLLIGRLVGLGDTTESPKAGITDYSIKETDQFGEVTVVERAWAKRMALRSMIRSDAIDLVASRIAAVRAKPALWIGLDGSESLTVYGFFKDFAIEVDTTISQLALTIEGLSTAGKVEPLSAVVDWPDVKDPFGTKPEDNATVGAPAGTPVAGRPAEDIVDGLDQLDDDVAAALAAVASLGSEADDIRNTLTEAQAAIIANGQGIQAAQQTLGDQGTMITNLQAVADNQAGQLAQLSNTVTAQGASVSQLLLASQTQEGQISSLQQNLTTANASITSLTASYSALDAAVAQAQQTLTTQGASISQNAQAITTANNQLATMQTQLTSGGGNLLTNSDLAADTSGWAFGASSMVALGLRNYGDTAFQLYGENNLSIVQANNGASGYANWVQSVVVGPGKWYDVSVLAAAQACTVIVYIQWFDSSGSAINAPSSSEQVVATGGQYLANWKQIGFKAQAPTNAVRANIILRKLPTASGNASSVAWFCRPQVAETRSTSATPIAYSAGSSRAVVLQHALSLDGLFARWGVELDVNGYVSGVALNNNGTRSDFIVSSDRFSVRKPGGVEKLEWANGRIFGTYSNGVESFEIGVLSA